MTSSITDLRQLPAQEAVFFPASFAQQRLWFIDQLTPGRATYNIPSALRIRGKLDLEVLERTLQEVARRHETLRTRFVAVGGEPQQVIEDQVHVQLPALDLTGVVGEEEREAEALRLAREEAQQPFDLQQAPLFRGKLLRLGALNHVLLFTVHHIISDAWSIGVLIEEVSVLYDAFSAGQPSPLPELPIQYADYSVWQRECLQAGVLEAQLAYWKRQLAGSSMLMLPTDRPRPAAQSQNGATCDFVIAANLMQELKKLAEEQGATLFMVLLAAFYTLLYRYSGQHDIAVGTPIAGRSSSATEKLIGFFYNTLVLRVDLSGAPSFTELLQRTKEVTLEAYAHQDVPFEKLVEVLSPERNLGSTPLFQVMISLHNAPISDLRLGSAELQPFNAVDNGTSKFDLLLQLGEDGSGMLMCSLQYSTDLFEAATIKRMIGHYSILLSSVTSTPRARVHLLEILSPEERSILLLEVNATVAPTPEKTITQLFEEQVDRTPNATAVRCGADSLSYIELNQRANQLAHHLKLMGVDRERPVGICLNRSLDMVVALLGILKLGGAYVPFDPYHPVERLGFMIEDAQIPILLTQASLRGSVGTTMVQIVSMDEDWKDISTNSVGSVEGRVHGSTLAYVIYTSGSIGQPKGAGVTHKGMVNYVNWARQIYKVSQGSGFPVHSSLVFDLTITSIYPALLTGGCVDVLSQSTGMDLKNLAQSDTDTPEQEYVGPRHATEETLCRLWQEVLWRERVGIHDNFFKIGGHSLRAAQVISRIKVAFAVEMPLSALFVAPTVARMAKYIAAMNEPERPQSSPVLVSIQPQGSPAPFFCVHAVGGQVISYAELSQELGLEQPFYGLQSPPANFFHESGISIEQLANLYNRELRSVQPVGPYLLGGWSMGGMVAWEMAQQLLKEGETIGLLALIDTTPPSRYQEADDRGDEISMLARFAFHMSRLIGRDPRPLAEHFSQAAAQDQWNMVQETLTSYGVLSPKTAHAEMTALLDVFTRNFFAVNNYSLHQSRQPVVFFRASETPEHLFKPWTMWATGGMQFHLVPGDHFTMLRRPNVGIIAEALQRHISANSSNQSLAVSPEMRLL